VLVQQRISTFKIQLIIQFVVIYRLRLVLNKKIHHFFFYTNKKLFSLGTNNSFRILLDKIENVSLNPREKFNIPIAFCPEYLARHEAQLRIVGRLPSGKTWSPDK